MLLFVYNIDSGVLQSLHDYSSKRPAAPGSDIITLKAITHSPLGMKKEWKRFLKELSIPSRCMDRNEFIAEFEHLATTFPIVFLKKGKDLSVFIGSEDLSQCRDLSDLIGLVSKRISRI